MSARNQARTPAAAAANSLPGDADDLATHWPADHIERRSVASLIPSARNARTHSDAQIAQLAASIREWGWTTPVLIDEAGSLIAGHGRILAARMLGLEQVPVMTATGWSEAKRRAYALADNQLALNAGWDPAMLACELNDLAAMPFDMSLIGFSAEELAELSADRTAGLTDPDDVPDLPTTPVSVPGDLWRLGKHRLICGDCTDRQIVERLFDGVKPHLMVTDPPYGVDYDPSWRVTAGLTRNTRKMGRVANDERADWREAWALFPGDVVYVWHGARFAPVVHTSLVSAGFDIRSQIIWVKDRFALSRGHYHWQHEPCLYAIRNGATGHWRGGRNQGTTWAINAREDKGHGHGTQKPVTCMKRPIENNSIAGQDVYDPFSGSGTTIIAAEMTDRVCQAIEVAPAYVDVAVRRWEAFTGQQATLERDGRTFGATADARLKGAA